jgi:hypothetical protein
MHSRGSRSGVAIFIAVMHSATPQRRKTAAESSLRKIYFLGKWM